MVPKAIDICKVKVETEFGEDSVDTGADLVDEKVEPLLVPTIQDLVRCKPTNSVLTLGTYTQRLCSASAHDSSC